MIQLYSDSTATSVHVVRVDIASDVTHAAIVSDLIKRRKHSRD